MRKKLGILCGVIGFTFFFICEGWGANWQLLNEYDYADGYSIKQYYDSESIVRTSEGSLRVWIRQNEEKVSKGPGEDVPFYKKLVEINCASGEVRYLRVLTHLKDGDYEEQGQTEMDYMVPDSSKEALQKAICKH